ncbi:MAG: polyphosphate kinase 1 [Methylophilaceae bacterium]
MESTTQYAFLDRDLSILSFNQRVLSLAQRQDYPLLERLRFLCIVALNLDEFFEVRMPQQLAAWRSGDTQGIVNAKSFAKNSEKAHALVAQQYQLYNEELMPLLAQHDILLLSNHQRNVDQKLWVEEYYQAQIKPLLVPVALDPSHPFPQVANKSLNFIVQLESVSDSSKVIAIVRVPRALPRLIKLPVELSDGKQCFVALSSVIRAHLDDLFTGAKIVHYSQFRVTRNSDLALDEDDLSNLRTALRDELAHRQYGQAVRLEVSHGCQIELATFLLEQFSLPELALYRVHGPVNLGRLIQLPDMAEGSELKFSMFKPAWPKLLELKTSIFEQLKQRDILIHQPYESFEAVLQLLQEAVYDDNVLAIHQTIYRTGSDERMLKLLQEAVRRGKEVLVVVELKARFDEEANINWAEAMESIGGQVVYGVVGLKTHAKMLLIMRREGAFIRRYGHISTGNYNPKTAKLYTDISMLTRNTLITRDMEHLFRHLTSQLPLPRMRRLLVAPFNLQQTILRKIKAATSAAAKGKAVKIIAKMNSLTDEVLVTALIQAAQAGVEIDLIVRGACILPLNLPDINGRIHIRSIVGRFLEHSRVFYFEINGKVNLWLSSADWMSRNMLRRVEIAWPILDIELQQRVANECLRPYLQDNQDAWLLESNGQYSPVGQQQKTDKNTKTVSAQISLMQKYGG